MAIPDFLKQHVLCFDTETAVLGDHICEIGWSLFENAELVHEDGMFVKPAIPMSKEASAVNHIIDDDLEDAPSFKEVASLVSNLLNSADVVVAYNGQYDFNVLSKEFERIGLTLPLKPLVDPFILFKQWYKYNKGKTLVIAAEKYGIPYIGAHRAMNDSTVTGRLLFKMAATKVNFPKDQESFIKKQRAWIEHQYLDFSKYMASIGNGPIDEPIYKYYEVM